MLKRIKLNFKYIKSRFTLIASIVFGIISVVQLFVTWDAIGAYSNNVKLKLLIFFIILGLCLVSAVIWGALLSKENILFVEDKVKISVKYGDLMKEAFPKKKKNDRIVVIAVNCCYDMIVNQDLIYKESVHGQFLSNYIHNDKDRENLEKRINDSLSEFDIYPSKILNREEKRYGNLVRYPFGSVARINGEKGVTFFLLALTEFDVDCKAHCDKHQYIDCILKLFEYYDAHGQGMDLYLYPMGTGMARTGLNKKEALEIIVLLTKISKEHLKAKTTIIVDKGDKNRISINDL